ncbi:hypothetical protein ACFWWM_14260 [Streptomyces sp. NPDC058682]|uniref:hypothetical protein n=1 Tax=Streptomyces sp. NPDC058682 TaxID=3346596 RepID=UPI0036481F4E
MTGVSGASAGAGPGKSAGSAGLGWATAGPAGIDPRERETVEHIVRAVRDADEARIRTLLADFAAVADMAALLYLRERLCPPLPGQ